MSAVEIIAMIEKLPPEEQAEVVSYVERRKADPAARTIRYASAAEAESVADQVFRDHKELFRKLAQ
jgi:hypothetical protein